MSVQPGAHGAALIGVPIRKRERSSIFRRPHGSGKDHDRLRRIHGCRDSSVAAFKSAGKHPVDRRPRHQEQTCQADGHEAGAAGFSNPQPSEECDQKEYRQQRLNISHDPILRNTQSRQTIFQVFIGGAGSLGASRSPDRLVFRFSRGRLESRPAATTGGPM